MPPEPTVGIDLGTTFSVVAYQDQNGNPQTILNMEGDLTTPSAVYFDDAAVVVGKEAIKAAAFEPDAVAQFAKRDMGKPEYHASIRGVKLPPEVIQAAILKKLKRDAEMKLGRVRDAVITVPAFFNEPRRKATMDAGRLAGLNVVDIINEPTAAAIAYGIHAGFLSPAGQAPQKEIVLVYDLGGGTFDATLMEIDGPTFTALATDGDVHLGGIDWDRRIVDFVADSFQEEHGVDLRQDRTTLQELMLEAEDAKRALTSRENVTIRYSHDGRRIQSVLTRDEFETITSDLLQRTIFTVGKLLRDARRSWRDLTRVLLVGGSTRMPMIQRALEGESGMSVDRSLSPDEAVAHGAAIYAGLLKQGVKASDRNLAVKNVNSHDLGVLAWEKATGMPRRRVMIPRNTTLPARSKSPFVTHRENQRKVIVNVIEGGDDSGKNSTSIGKCLVTDLPPNLPRQTPVVVQFVYGTNGRLSVSASLPTIGKEVTMAIERTSGMSKSLLESWEQRIAADDYFPSANVTDTPRPAAARPSDSSENLSVQPANEDFDAPQVFENDEDSEIFADLDF